MILLDTNIVSELIRPIPDPKVVFWLDEQPEGDIWISAVTLSEISFVIPAIPDSAGFPRDRWC
jgi:predicted nucleic acid-binding protein